MSIRHHFDQQLDALRDQILLMGSRVQDELVLALDALTTLDPEKAKAVAAADQVVNEMRFSVEEACFTLIATQQPAARDLRTIIAAMNVIVDLERMGDQAKGIAKVVQVLRKNPGQEMPGELRQMGSLVQQMLDDAMRAYATSDADLARDVAGRDHVVDALYGRVFTKILQQMAVATTAERAEPIYDTLRVARELERFGDLATNVAERIIYLVTGAHVDMNTSEVS
jgi:phosphate transport system protein